MFNLTGGNAREEKDEGMTLSTEANQGDQLAWWLDLAFVLWLAVSVTLFLGQFWPFIVPLLKKLGIQ